MVRGKYGTGIANWLALNLTLFISMYAVDERDGLDIYMVRMAMVRDNPLILLADFI